MKSKINNLISKIWYWYNSKFGERTYYLENGKPFIREGYNKPEPLEGHEQKHHKDEDIL